jgi:DNA mismatch repair protein MutS
VARLAGVPRNVIQDARRYLAELERRDHASRPDAAQQTLDLGPAVDPCAQDLLETLDRVDPDALSPRDALALLFELKNRLARGSGQ